MTSPLGRIQARQSQVCNQGISIEVKGEKEIIL